MVENEAAGENAAPRRRIRMIALDLDNTTLRTDKSLADRTRDALTEALARGVEVVISTGRVRSSLPENILSLNGLRYVINSNGARITDLRTEKVVYENCLPAESLDRVIALSQEYGAPVELLTGGDVFMDAKAYHDLEKNGSDVRYTSYVLWSRKPVPDIWQLAKDRRDQIETVSMNFEDLALRETMLRVLADVPGISLTSSVPFNIEVEHRDTSKANALKILLDRFGMTKDELLACGDSPNDREMIELAGIGVAVANATDDVREAADYITDSNNEDGVAKAVEKFVLNV